MTVQLEVGMTAICRDGVRVGPVETFDASDHPYQLDGVWYGADGLSNITPSKKDIIAAGYPWWATLGAQVGDTVHCVWSGYNPGMLEWPEFIKGSPCDIEGGAPHPDSLYVIVKPAAKPADRPRASHKLGLQDGDRVRLDAWQDGTSDYRGRVYEKRGGRLVNVDDPGDFWNLPLTDIPKGERPLFTVLPRAADAKPEVIVLHGAAPHFRCMGQMPRQSDTHSFTITFPHGSDTGTVVKETL